MSFRKKFQLPDSNVLRWFPGHMGKGLKQIQQKLKTVDCLVEVHDARIPLSGRNPHFTQKLCGIRPHLLVLNKEDLSNRMYRDRVAKHLHDQGLSNYLYTNCKNQKCPGIDKLVPLVQELISKSNRYHRNEANSFNIMIIGVPNVGKSSLINTLRNKILKKSNAAPVGAVAGITRSVTTQIRISDDPLIYVLDTPGILSPNVPDIKSGMKLALCATMQDHMVGSMLIADYLLFTMNCDSNYKYVDYLGLKEPTDDIREALTIAAVTRNKLMKVNTMTCGYTLLPDLEFAANLFIRAFRTGELGKYMLDSDII